MKYVDEIIQEIEFCIESGGYRKMENEHVELKDNSHNHSQWNEVYKTVNAFLNSNGGIILLGIKEDEANKKYVLTGYNDTQANEDKIKELKTSDLFSDNNKGKVNVRDCINFETKKVNGVKVLAIYVDQLSDDEKYVFYEQKAYKRILTGDHKISQAEIESQEEYKQEIKGSREIKIVPNSSLEDLDVDKLNDYIQLNNREVKVYNIKASINDSIDFLSSRFMLRENLPTILGILVCGKDPESKLQFASEVHAYVESDSNEIVAQNKKMINGTVIELMEQSVAFVFRNIKTGVSLEKAGSRTYEYPERLIRECINNSLAHRDYSVNRFVSINIVPGKHIEIRNPGSFKHQLLITDLESSTPIRRIIAGNPKANNPKLAKVLSVFSKYEGKGYGIATVVNACLDNLINVPYYRFHSKEELSLFIPEGKLVDAEMQAKFLSYEGYISDKLEGVSPTEEQKRVIAYLYKSEILNRADEYTILLTKANNHLQAIGSLENAGLISRHGSSSDITTVYVLDKNLFKKSFYEQLVGIFGARYLELNQEHKEILAYIFERNNFGLDKYPNANEVGSTLWIKKGNAQKLEGFESYKRKVRDLVNKLVKGAFLEKVDGKPKYRINTLFYSNRAEVLL